MRNITTLVLVIIAALMLLSCAPPISEGTVIAKRYEAERRWTTTTFIQVGGVQVPNTIHHFAAESFIIMIEGTNIDGDLQRREVKVSETVWNKITVGDHYKVPAEYVDETEPEEWDERMEQRRKDADDRLK